MKFQDQSLNLLNVDEDNKPLVKQLNFALQFLSKFSNNGVNIGENLKHEIKTVTLRDGEVRDINHNGKAPPACVVLLDGRVDWLRTISKDNNKVSLMVKTMDTYVANTNSRVQIINFSSARYFMKDDTIACGEYRAKVSAATTTSITLERAISLVEPLIRLYEEKVTLLFLW